MFPLKVRLINSLDVFFISIFESDLIFIFLIIAIDIKNTFNLLNFNLVKVIKPFENPLTIFGDAFTWFIIPLGVRLQKKMK